LKRSWPSSAARNASEASAHGLGLLIQFLTQIRIKTGLLKTAGALDVIIITAGRGQENIAFETYAYTRKVALGEIEDPATLPILFEAPND